MTPFPTLPWEILSNLLHSLTPIFLSTVPDCMASISFFRLAELSASCWLSSSSSPMVLLLTGLYAVESLTPRWRANISRVVLLSLFPDLPGWEMIGEGVGRLSLIKPRRKCTSDCVLDMVGPLELMREERRFDPYNCHDLCRKRYLSVQMKRYRGEGLDGEEMVLNLNGFRYG